jgi:sugar O-acyltransferase (sialic acid O-acetyltransferase NeuD family)
MVIAGAGGHALEVYDVLLALNYAKDDLVFYDDISGVSNINNCKVLKSVSELKEYFIQSNEFCLGIGNPILRKKLYDLMIMQGGKHFPVVSSQAIISEYAINKGADIMPNCFISSKVILGLGTLINTSSNIHHEVEIGEFNEISPASVILGKVKIKSFCSIGSNATLLPNIKISESVIVGAGAVVTTNIDANKIIKGVPAK